MERKLFFVYTLFAERFAHLFQCSAVGFLYFQIFHLLQAHGLEDLLTDFANRFITTNIPDLQALRLLFALDGAVPEGFGFLAIANDIAQLVDFDLAVGVPFAFGGGAVQTQEFDQFQTILADLDESPSG